MVKEIFVDKFTSAGMDMPRPLRLFLKRRTRRKKPAKALAKQATQPEEKKMNIFKTIQSISIECGSDGLNSQKRLKNRVSIKLPETSQNHLGLTQVVGDSVPRKQKLFQIKSTDMSFLPKRTQPSFLEHLNTRNRKKQISSKIFDEDNGFRGASRFDMSLPNGSMQNNLELRNSVVGNRLHRRQPGRARRRNRSSSVWKLSFQSKRSIRKIVSKGISLALSNVDAKKSPKVADRVRPSEPTRPEASQARRVNHEMTKKMRLRFQRIARQREEVIKGFVSKKRKHYAKMFKSSALSRGQRIANKSSVSTSHFQLSLNSLDNLWNLNSRDDDLARRTGQSAVVGDQGESGRAGQCPERPAKRIPLVYYSRMPNNSNFNQIVNDLVQLKKV